MDWILFKTSVMSVDSAVCINKFLEKMTSNSVDPTMFIVLRLYPRLISCIFFLHSIWLHCFPKTITNTSMSLNCFSEWHVPSLSSTHTVVIFDSIQNTLFWCHKYSLEHRKCMTPLLKIVWINYINRLFKATMDLNFTIHLLLFFFFFLSRAGSQGQLPQQGHPDFPLPGHFLQLFRENPKAFPGQLSDIVTLACPGSSSGSLPSGTCQEDFLREASWGHPKQMPEPPHLAPLDGVRWGRGAEALLQAPLR